MGFREDSLWFRHASSASSSDGKAAKLWDDSDKDRQERERAFNIADYVEKGFVREVSTEFVHPLQRSSKLWRFHVMRSDDKMDYRLYSDAGEFLLFARALPTERRIGIFLYNPGGDQALLHDPDRPAFTVLYNEAKTHWRLVKEQCELCQYRSKHRSCDLLGKQQLVHIEHKREPLGDGIFNCMDIRIPGLFNDGSRVVFCPATGYEDLAAATAADDYEVLRLRTKRPEWNEDVESLVLDFKGRCITASAKNFQLALAQKPDQVICQYGKIGNSTFSLDIRFPLSISQAFAMSLSTIFWT